MKLKYFISKYNLKKGAYFFGLFLISLCFFSCGKSTTPKVPNYPVISYFRATPSEISYGESSTLSWSISNATSAEIDQGVGSVSLSGSKEVSPKENITYRLSAINSDGSTTKTCTVKVIARAIFELTSYSYGYTSYDCCEITGIVKNVGNATGYNVMIEFQAYNANNVIIDTAHGFPADLGNIPVGVSAAFDAVFFDLYDWNDIAEITYEITWLTAQGMRLTQTGIVPFKLMIQK